MNIKKIFSILIFTSTLLVSGFAIAQTSANINYPISELGDCESKSACREYCDNPSHTGECLDFAEEHKMMTEEEVTQAKTMTQAINEGGPGGCQSKSECGAYCEHTDHLEECIAFAEEYDFIPQKELERIKAMAKAHNRGVTSPGNCQTKTECEAYCEEPEHIEECLNYAEDAGFTPPGNVEKTRQMVRLMKLGKTPGGCQSPAECKEYCEDGEYMEECLDFAVEVGNMTEEEAREIKERGPKEGVHGGPKEPGPGGCQSEEECEKYCNEHQRECIVFAKKNGLMTEEETEMIEKDLAQLQMGIKEAPPEALECVKNQLGEEVVQKIKSGEYIPGPATGKKINQCMQEHEQKMAQEFANSIKEAPEVVTTCLKEKFGEEKFNNFINGQLPQNSEDMKSIESCFQKSAQMSEQESEKELNRLKQDLENAPTEVINCLNQIKNNFVDKVRSGEYVPDPEQAEEIFKCFEKFSSERPEGTDRSKEMSGEDIIQNIIDKVPQEARGCIKNNLTQDIIDKMKTRESLPEEFKMIMEKCVGPMEMDKKQPPEDMNKKPPPEDMNKKPPPEGEMMDKDKEMMEDDKPPLPEDKEN